jgi:hypothetical protein
MAKENKADVKNNSLRDNSRNVRDDSSNPRDDSRVDVSTSDEPKTYDEKVADYEEHFDGLGMHDPGTEARVAAMKTASDPDEAPELAERRRVREAKAAENRGITDEAKATNERLSEELKARKAHDLKETEATNQGLKTNIQRGGSQGATKQGQAN